MMNDADADEILIAWLPAETKAGIDAALKAGLTRREILISATRACKHAEESALDHILRKAAARRTCKYAGSPLTVIAVAAYLDAVARFPGRG